MSIRLTVRHLLAAAMIFGLGACSDGFRTAYETPVGASSWRVADVRVSVPDSLTVSEENILLPAADIVWQEEPKGDRRAQVDAIMTAAIKRAGIMPSDIDYINAHGTSTMADTIELGAVERVVGNAASKISMSSTKSSVGHLLGAAGAAEAIFSLLAIRDNVAPATINLDNPSVETEIDLVPNKPRERQIDIALSNSFGFGGTNASLIFRRHDA